MSGITPILDTLLHQVLGKRVDIPVNRDQPAPVSAATSEDAVQSARSDSRLHQQSQSRLADVASAMQRGNSAPAFTRSGESASSTQTHLSRAATDIAALLAKFPASGAAPRAVQTPLFAETTTQSNVLASSLREAVVSSGAFYESHLLRWSQGTFPTRALWREPQAWLALTFRPAPGLPLSLSAGHNAWLKSLPMPRPNSSIPQSAADAPAGARQQSFQGPLLSATARSPAPPLAPHRGSTATETEALEGTMKVATASDAMTMRSHQLGGQAAPETLQSLVRHQLELLVAPQIHWAGDVWPNAPVSVHIQPEESRDESPARQPGELEAADTWHTRVQITLPRLGEVTLTLENRADEWKIQIQPDDVTAIQPLEGAVGELQSRLRNARVVADVTLAGSDQ